MINLGRKKFTNLLYQGHTISLGEGLDFRVTHDRNWYLQGKGNHREKVWILEGLLHRKKLPMLSELAKRFPEYTGDGFFPEFETVWSLTVFVHYLRKLLNSNDISQ